MITDGIKTQSASISARVNTCRLCSMFSTFGVVFCINYFFFYDKPKRCWFYSLFSTTWKRDFQFEMFRGSRSSLGAVDKVKYLFSNILALNPSAKTAVPVTLVLLQHLSRTCWELLGTNYSDRCSFRLQCACAVGLCGQYCRLQKTSFSHCTYLRLPDKWAKVKA